MLRSLKNMFSRKKKDDDYEEEDDTQFSPRHLTIDVNVPRSPFTNINQDQNIAQHIQILNMANTLWQETICPDLNDYLKKFDLKKIQLFSATSTDDEIRSSYTYQNLHSYHNFDDWVRSSCAFQQILCCLVRDMLDKTKISNIENQEKVKFLNKELFNFLQPIQVVRFDDKDATCLLRGYIKSPYTLLRRNEETFPLCLIKVFSKFEQSHVNNHLMLHEIAIMSELNLQRNFIPYYAFFYGAFYCSPPSTVPYFSGVNIENFAGYLVGEDQRKSIMNYKNTLDLLKSPNSTTMCSDPSSELLSTFMCFEDVMYNPKDTELRTTFSLDQFLQPFGVYNSKFKLLVILQLIMSNYIMRLITGFYYNHVDPKDIFVHDMKAYRVINCAADKDGQIGMICNTQYIPKMTNFSQSVISTQHINKDGTKTLIVPFNTDNRYVLSIPGLDTYLFARLIHQYDIQQGKAIYDEVYAEFFQGDKIPYDEQKYDHYRVILANLEVHFIQKLANLINFNIKQPMIHVSTEKAQYSLQELKDKYSGLRSQFKERTILGQKVEPILVKDELKEALTMQNLNWEQCKNDRELITQLQQQIQNLTQSNTQQSTNIDHWRQQFLALEEKQKNPVFNDCFTNKEKAQQCLTHIQNKFPEVVGLLCKGDKCIGSLETHKDVLTITVADKPVELPFVSSTVESFIIWKEQDTCKTNQYHDNQFSNMDELSCDNYQTVNQTLIKQNYNNPGFNWKFMNNKKIDSKEENAYYRNKYFLWKIKSSLEENIKHEESQINKLMTKKQTMLDDIMNLGVKQFDLQAEIDVKKDSLESISGELTKSQKKSNESLQQLVHDIQSKQEQLK